MIYKMQTATLESIYKHLNSCDNDYIPPLSSRVNLSEYSAKIYKKALSFEAWDENLLVGMINAYFNDSDSRSGFITNVSVLRKYRSQGIASRLLRMCIDYAQQNQFLQIKLETSSKNNPALTTYMKAGFKVVQVINGNFLMMYENKR
jgi:ribosomal protein S18 acetylase RimI-like enzyme